MAQTFINKETVTKILKQNKLSNVGKASIREVKKLINDIEKETGEKFIRMEMGIPGLPACQIGIDAE
ncbi:MAG: pyridoxal phosphate-dependent aminotransferase, partial [Bacteroidales bacterium]